LTPSAEDGTVCRMNGHPQKVPGWAYAVLSVALSAVVVWAVLALDPERAVAFSTGVLVLVTAFYAFQTQRMAVEMASARAEQVRPHVVLDVEKLGAGQVLLRVTNVGVGSAVGVDVRLSAEPGALDIPYTTPVLSPGEGQSFIVRDAAETGVFDLRQLVDTLKLWRVLLTGECRDALQNKHDVADTLDLREYADAFYSGYWRSQPDELKRIADELKRIADGR
jgi:hypothetical protein